MYRLFLQSTQENIGSETEKRLTWCPWNIFLLSTCLFFLNRIEKSSFIFTYEQKTKLKNNLKLIKSFIYLFYFKEAFFGLICGEFKKLKFLNLWVEEKFPFFATDRSQLLPLLCAPHTDSCRSLWLFFFLQLWP